MSDLLWVPYEAMGEYFEQHATDGAYNAHYDRPAVLQALGPVRGLPGTRRRVRIRPVRRGAAGGWRSGGGLRRPHK